MATIFEQITGIWADMAPGRRLLLGMSLFVVVAGLVWLITTQSTTQWTPLGRGLTAEDIQSAKTALDAKNIPVRLTEGGILEVPKESLDEARIEIATTNAASGSVGMELFNESTFGQSAFQETVNYHRALQGELARTIQSINGIKAARVHLVIPKKRLFKKDQKLPTASVKLSINGTYELTKKQVSGIRFLVANAIEGLSPTAVTIIDNSGNMLARPDDGMMAGGQSHHELQLTYETKLEQRIVELLTPLVGDGKVQAQVSATLDFSQVELTEKTLDPENQVVTKENRHVETSSSQTKEPRGVPGVASNVPGRPGASGGSSQPTSSKSMRKEALSYDTNSSLKTTRLPMGRLQRLSVAVAVDGRTETAEDGAESWAGRGADEMAQFEDLVSKAVGINLERGDQLAVVNTQFNAIIDTLGDVAPTEKPFWMTLIPSAVLFVICVLLFFGVLRPLIRQYAERSKAQLIQSQAPGQLTGRRSTPGLTPGEAGAEGLRADGTTAPRSLDPPAIPLSSGERLRQVAIQQADRDVPRAAQIIRTWLLVEE
jgi:flagellar M-ring protein FliF